MNRRGFLANGARVAVGAAVVSQFSLEPAFAASGEQVLIESEIGRNHGHGLNLDTADVVKMLRKAELENDPEQTVSIQGESGHPHVISLNQSSLMMLLLGEVLNLESSVDAGHSHSVLVSMNVQAV